MKYNTNIINKDTYAEMRVKYNNSPEHKNYCWIRKNLLVKQVLLEKYNYKCQYCGNDLDETAIVHHTTYDHCCKNGYYIKLLSPTLKRPERHVKVPDCETCKSQTPNKFEQCISLVVPVCNKCNFRISLVAGKTHKNSGNDI